MRELLIEKLFEAQKENKTVLLACEYDNNIIFEIDKQIEDITYTDKKITLIFQNSQVNIITDNSIIDIDNSEDYTNCTVTSELLNINIMIP